MNKIRITKQFNFETAHALYGYDGKCKNVHGHSYKLFVTVIGTPIEDTNDVKLGMVIDFGDLKKNCNRRLHEVRGFLRFRPKPPIWRLDSCGDSGDYSRKCPRIISGISNNLRLRSTLLMTAEGVRGSRCGIDFNPQGMARGEAPPAASRSRP